MQTRTPISVITGPLGSGKTTLLGHMLDLSPRKLAIIMNEFGEIAVDSKIIEGKSIRIAELAGGCVCCSLVGEFEAAVNEIIDTVNPDQIVLETTGVAEPGAVVMDIQNNLPRVRLDGVISVIDADGMLRFPALGHTSRLQIEEADIILLNKIDLIGLPDLASLEQILRGFNPDAPIVPTNHCRVELDLLFGLHHAHKPVPSQQLHKHDFDSFSFTSHGVFDRAHFEAFVSALGTGVFRAKGFVHFDDGSYLFNFVRNRWELEPFPHEGTELIFIGPRLNARKDHIIEQLKSCEHEPVLR